MKNFRRSLKYLWPYRLWLAAASGCVLLIAVLWGGGLAAMLPGAKILISQEGLHGWAYDKVTEDRLGVGIGRRWLPSGLRTEATPALVMEITSVAEAGPADKAGLGKAQWIVGMDEGGVARRPMEAHALSRGLAQRQAGQIVGLYVYDQNTQLVRRAELKLGRAGLSARLLGRIARAVPEPSDPSDYAARYPMLLWLLAFGVVVTVLRDLLRFSQEYLVGAAVVRSMLDLRCENYNVALRLPTTFFSKQGVSDSMSRFLQDTSELSRGQQTLFGQTLVEPAKALSALAVALAISWRLTLLAMVAGPPAFLLIRNFAKIMRKASRRALESWAVMVGVLSETLSGISVVKAYTMEAAQRKRFLRVNRQLLRQQKRMVAADSATAPTVEALGILAAMLAMAVAGYWVLHGMHGMDPDKFLALMACLAAMFDPVRKLARVVARFQLAESAAARIFELHDRQQEKHLPGAPTLPRHQRDLVFRQVSFRYPEASQLALDGIDLAIPAGQTLAIVGPNGSGKTTLVSLVPRLIDPTRGQVLIDGRDVAAHSLRSLRRQIALVSQEPVIFNASVAENIACGKRRARAEEVAAAGRAAYVEEFALEMPDGYDTIVGERGATLSGGQRQRIAIARAIVRDPAVLIFDEAMSQVDPDSERKIHRAMEAFRTGRTTLMIAHRLATVLEADRIAVMDAGRIVDVGAHEELLQRCDVYAQLYQTQLARSGPS